jgi:hypothetical protein
MNVDVKTVALPYEFTKPTGNPLFYVEEARLSNEQYDGQMSTEAARVNFERGDGVGAPPYI